MVKSSDGESLSIAPFLKKCYEMVDDESTNSAISWGQNNDSFVIWDMTEFSVQLLPKYFKHSNSSSFIRQLNIYGFRKIDADRWEFSNDGFIRGQKHLLKTICRRKHSQVKDDRKSLPQQDSPAGPCEQAENGGLWKEVENLKIDKSALMQELVKLRQHQETADNKLLLLRDRIQGMEKNQQQMLSFLVMAMQSPGFLVQLLHPKENNWRMAESGSMVEQGADDAKPLASDGMIIRYQPPMEEMPKAVHAPPITAQKPQESNPSDGMKDFFISPEFMKALMDENLCSFENHGPFLQPENQGSLQPELSVDIAWEQLLLASPFLENIEDSEPDTKGTTDADIKMGTTESESPFDGSQKLKLPAEQMELTQKLDSESTIHGVHWENFQILELLTKQMDHLASEADHKHEV